MRTLQDCTGCGRSDPEPCVADCPVANRHPEARPSGNTVECPRCGRAMSFQDGMKRAWCGNCGERFGIIDAAPTTEERVASQVTEMAIELSNDVDAAREELKGWKRAFVRLSGELSVRGKVEASCIIAGLTEKQTVAVLTAFGALGSPDMVLGYEERPERDTWPR